MLKGLSGQSRVSWLLVKHCAHLLPFIPNNYSPNDGPHALNTEKPSAGRPDFPHSSLCLILHRIQILVQFCSEIHPRLQNPRRGVMREQVAAVVMASFCKSGPRGSAGQRAVIRFFYVYLTMPSCFHQDLL